ncbi:hypothetical protein SAMN02910358_00879 [Lachnospiraceae bacterium XBB1006]|nr:hypothetical protein SAMN02910358_00879 [Lachnospiraceae bacterium XBB1006]
MDFQEDQFHISKHYITDSIRKVYKKRLALPILILVLLGALWFIFPIKTFMFPRPIKQGDVLTKRTFSRQSGVSVTIDHLYFTGYTSSMFGRSNGYYYYTTWNDKCLIVLLSPSTCQEGLPSMKHVTIHANIHKPGRSYDQLLFQLSKDLNWTTDGLLEQMDTVYLEEFSVKNFSTFAFLLLYLGVFLYTVVYLILCILWCFFPRISPPVLTLRRFGNPKQMLAMAEEELSTLPQLATEDMFITEHYFIEISMNGIAIVPIEEIIWIYKHSTLHKFLWYHFIISYTLHITGNHHFYLRCPKNIKSDIDGIMDYLAEANHNILVGFNEENRLKVQEIQNHSLHLEGFFNFLKKRI